MPLFYLRPFKFHPKHTGPGLGEQLGLITFVFVMGVILFGVLIVIPLIMVLSQSTGG